MSWTQPICADCYTKWIGPVDTATRIKEAFRDEERCCACGVTNRDGLYIRIDPTKAPYPS